MGKHPNDGYQIEQAILNRQNFAIMENSLIAANVVTILETFQKRIAFTISNTWFAVACIIVVVNVRASVSLILTHLNGSCPNRLQPLSPVKDHHLSKGLPWVT